MSALSGLNQFVTLTVPAGNTEGPAADVSALKAQKTIFLSGDFDGDYVILGSHDGTVYVPVASFEGDEEVFGNSGPQMLKRDIDFTLQFMRVRRLASASVNIVVAAQETCACS